MSRNHFRENFFGLQSILIAGAATLLSLAAVGCGPSLNSTMPAPHVALSNKPPASETSAYLFIDEIKDVRDNRVLVKREKKEVTAEGELTPSVVEALKQAFGTKGFTFSESSPIIISGELREWHADVSGSLPTKVAAQSAIYIEVLDPANKKIYSGVYRGFASLEEASIDEKDVSKTLANALQETVTQVVNDKQLVGVLSSF